MNAHTTISGIGLTQYKNNLISTLARSMKEKSLEFIPKAGYVLVKDTQSRKKILDLKGV